MRPRISSKHLASVFSTVGHVSGPVSLLECFAPAVSPAFSFRNRQTISRVEVSRTYATEAPKKQTVLNARSSSHQASEDISSLESSSSAAKTNWVAQLDHYLPLSLRSKSWVQNLAEFDGVKSAQTLPKLLKNARPFFFQGLLGHIAINEGRGDALLWLVNAILSLQRPDGSRPLEKLQADSPWPGSKSLTSLTNDYVDLKECEVDPDQGPRPATTPVFVGDDLFVQADAGFEFHGALGQIWQCLGHMVLESECLATENSVQRMLYVHQILAMMHTQGVVSPVIYDYQSDNVPLIRRKPPILHLTSSRIMTVLSDSTWKASEGEILRDSSYVAASYKLKGQEMPGSEFVPQVRSLGPEIWLEFVLWSCLHGDHFIEAMSIIRHMVATNKWKASTWEKVQSIATKKRESPIDQAQTSSRLRWLASAFEGYSKGKNLS